MVFIETPYIYVENT